MAESRLKGWLDWAHHLYWISEGLVSLGAGKAITHLAVTVLHVDSAWQLPIWLILSGILLFCFALFTSRRKTHGPEARQSKLVIHSASYAAIDGEGVDYDVTAFLQQIMAGDSLVFEIENHNFVVNGHNFVPKDPKFGIVKRLQVTYSYGNGPADRIERPEHSRLVLPEDSQLKILAAGFAAIQQQKPLFSPLQIQVLQLRAGLIQFLKEIGSLPRLGADSTTQGTVDYMVQYAEHKRDVEGPWLAGLRSHYVLKFKAEAEKIYHLLSVNGLVDPQLRHLASEADSPETIQALADALWEVGGRISV